MQDQRVALSGSVAEMVAAELLLKYHLRGKDVRKGAGWGGGYCPYYRTQAPPLHVSEGN